MKKQNYDKPVYHAAMKLYDDEITISHVLYYADTREKVHQWVKQRRGGEPNIVIGELPEEVIERNKGG